MCGIHHYTSVCNVKNKQKVTKMNYLYWFYSVLLFYWYSEKVQHSHQNSGANGQWRCHSHNSVKCCVLVVVVVVAAAAAAYALIAVPVGESITSDTTDTWRSTRLRYLRTQSSYYTSADSFFVYNQNTVTFSNWLTRVRDSAHTAIIISR